MLFMILIKTGAGANGNPVNALHALQCRVPPKGCQSARCSRMQILDRGYMRAKRIDSFRRSQLLEAALDGLFDVVAFAPAAFLFLSKSLGP